MELQVHDLHKSFDGREVTYNPEKSCMEFPFPYQAARHWDCWDATVPVSLRRFAF